MASFNRVILVGNVTREVQLQQTQAQTSVTNLGMAVNEKHKNQGGGWVDSTLYCDVTLWGRTAEVAAEYLRKGSPVLIEGRLKLESWKQNGEQRSKLAVVGEKMQMLGSKPAASASPHQEPAAVAGDEEIPVDLTESVRAAGAEFSAAPPEQEPTEVPVAEETPTEF